MAEINQDEQKGFMQDPYRFFSQVSQGDYISWVKIFSMEGWLVTGYHEIDKILKDKRFINELHKIVPPEEESEVPESLKPIWQMNQKMMLFRDAPDHTRLRKLVNKAFTPKMIEKLRPAIEQVTDDLIDEMRKKTKHELIADFSYLLPMLVITELLGIPKEDRYLFRSWSNAFIKFIDFDTTMDELLAISDEIFEARAYIKDLVDVKRIYPKEDLISHLIKVEEQGDALTEEELIATCLLLLVAGHETTTNLITNGFYLLLNHPDQLKRLKENRNLISNAVEEILRFEPPVLMTSRWAAEDMEFEGKFVKKAQNVRLPLAAGNRDPRINENPDSFDVTRGTIKHLSFSSGPHFCLGAPLARLEGQIAIGRLIQHFQNPVLMEKPVWRENIAFRGLHSLKFAGMIN